jgi:mannan endo-1,4-beta-mannosidase
MIVGWQRARNGLRNTGLRVLVFALLSAPAVVSAAEDPSATSFIKTSGTNFTLDGRPFFVTGVNNHCLPLGRRMRSPAFSMTRLRWAPMWSAPSSSR